VVNATDGYSVAIHGFLRDEYLNEVLRGAAMLIEERGLAVTLCDYRESLSEGDGDLSQPQPWRGKASGLIVFAAERAGYADWLVQGGARVLSVGADFSHPSIARVGVEDGSIGRLAAAHFAQVGARGVLHVGRAGSEAAANRRQALRQSLEAGPCQWLGAIDLPEDLALRYRSTGDASDPRFAELASALRHAPRPVGVMTLRDQYARQVCDLARQMGLGIPEQVMVVGVGNQTLAHVGQPPVTSIELPAARIGRRAMETLHRWITTGHKPNRRIQLPAERLVPRASTVPRDRGDHSIDWAIQYLRDNACRPIRVEDVLEAANISRTTFEKWFVDVVGCTPNREMQRILDGGDRSESDTHSESLPGDHD